VADPDDIDASLAIARLALRPPAEASERVRARLAATRTLAAPPLAAPPLAVRRIGVTKLTTTLLVGAGFVAGYWLGLQHDIGSWGSSLRPRPVEAVATVPAHASGEPRATSVPLSAGAPQAGPSPAEASVASSPPALGAPASSEAPGARSERAARPRHSARAVDRSGEELALLSRAERAIRAREPELALSFLDDLERRYPSSMFLEERAAARLLARCMLWPSLARADAERFLREHAGSVYSDRLQRACALDAPSASSTADGSGAGGH
jgi:hypothetical protein